MGRRALKFVSVAGVLLFTLKTWAVVFLDEDKSMQFTMRTYTQVRVSTEKPYLFRAGYNVYDFTTGNVIFQPTYNIGAWSLLQHRSYLEPQLNIDLRRRENVTPALRFLKEKLVIDNLKFFMGVRVEYDGIYDYGPDLYRNRVPQATRDELRLKMRLFEVYGDFRFLKRLSLRIGKQNLSWGEADLFRILDIINPLDQTFGGFLIPLDERRVPSFMIKGLLDLGSLGPIYNISLEGFVEPKPALVEGPTLPLGSPWAIVTGPPTPFPFVLEKKEAWKDARGGFRLLLNFLDFTMTLANYWTYPDIPTPRLHFNKDRLNELEEGFDLSHEEKYDDLVKSGTIHQSYPAGIPELELDYPRIMVTGATLSGPLPFSPYTILRAEVAYFWDHPYFLPAQCMPVLGPVLELSTSQVDQWDYIGVLDAALRQLNIITAGVEGTIPRSDVIRWMVGFDHNMWVRFLNPRQTFFISVQFFGEHWRSLKPGASFTVQKDARVARVTPPGSSEPTDVSRPVFVEMSPNSYKATYLIKTGYTVGRGYLYTQVGGAFDFGDFSSFSYLVQPALQYYFEPFRITLEYSLLGGDYAGIGFLKDRDNIMLKVEYVL